MSQKFPLPDDFEGVVYDPSNPAPQPSSKPSKSSSSSSAANWYDELPWFESLPDAYKVLIQNNPYAHDTPSYHLNTLFGGSKYEIAEAQRIENFRNWNMQVYTSYLSYLNSLPSTQISQQREAGLNTAISGASGVSPSSIEGPQANPTAYPEDNSSSLEAFGSVMSILGNVVSGVFGGISTCVSAMKTVAETKGVALDNIGKEFNNDILPQRWQMEYRNFQENLKNMSLSRKIQRNNEERAAYGFGANLRKAGYSMPDNIKGSSSAVQAGYKSADKASRVEDFSRLYLANKYISDPAFGAFVDTDFNPQPYMMDYINLNRSWMDVQARARFIHQKALNSIDKYQASYYSVLDPVSAAGATNAENKYNKEYYKSLDANALAVFENERAKFNGFLESYRLEMFKQYQDMFDRWYSRANAGDLLATQMVGGLMGLNFPAPSAPWNYLGGQAQNALSDIGNFLFPGVGNIIDKIRTNAQSNYQEYLDNPGNID